ncbi:MAG: hypothetical protein M1820_010671 [Bogoriella megaspora]|nr:MAG: hypothetical protein M1820_010671 [Bogoriella megaspora]
MESSPTHISPASPTSPGVRPSSRSKQAACVNCRKSKIRCRRDGADLKCEKCLQSGSECVVPDYHVGRRKGVKNKRRGLDKAVYQLEQAIAKSAAPDSVGLQRLLDDSRKVQPHPETGPELHNGTSPQTPLSTVDGNELDDAENPLQLLARASDLHVPTSRAREDQDLSGDHQQVKWYFAPVRAKPDVGLDVDPIELGLVTPEEAESLFTYFYTNLAQTRWGMDPVIHTVNFVRSQSAFLFTSIMASSALFIPSAAALWKRLSKHSKFLANRVMTQRYRSVEIVLAFMVNVPWMQPGEQSADDETCLYLATALTIALDLSLDKVVVDDLHTHARQHERLLRADCIDARRALHMDGFQGMSPSSEWCRRLLRRRERVWIALWNLERGVCFARGRRFIVPMTPLIQQCDDWPISDIAYEHDCQVVSMVVLRRDLEGLVNRIRASCDNFRIIDIESEVAKSMKSAIEGFFSSWFATWSVSLGGGNQYNLPPYVKILTTHTILTTYCMVINHPTAPAKVKHVFHSEALSSALKVMRAAVQGESRLQSMPNNTAIMISFAACFALKLSNGPLSPSVRDLIHETANVLQRIGSTPSHRYGASVLYGRYLQEVLKSARKSSGGDGIKDAASTNMIAPIIPSEQPQAQPYLVEPLQFSTMSDEQIYNAINEVGVDMNMQSMDTGINDLAGLDWLGWIDPFQEYT